LWQETLIFRPVAQSAYEQRFVVENTTITTTTNNNNTTTTNKQTNKQTTRQCATVDEQWL
jgi:hypothetical protein